MYGQQITPPPSGKIRNSNLELLRIVCMFLVLFIHYIPTRMTLSPDTIRSDFFNSIVQLEMSSLCFVCVNCFVIVSGYFNIKWKIKSFSRLLYTILFWGIIAYAMSLLVSDNEGSDFSIMNFIITNFTLRWFIGAYLILYILSPVINAFIEKCSSRQLGIFLIYFYAFSTIYGWLMGSQFFNEGMSFLSLMGLYILGAFLKRTNFKFFTLKASYNLLIYLGLGIILVVINAFTYYFGINKSLYGYLNPIIILESIYLFLFFKNLNIGYLPWINVVAGSAFSVYLFHHSAYIFPYYIRLSNWINENSEISLLYMLGIIALIFLFCTLVDYLSKPLFNLIYNLLSYKNSSLGLKKC